MQIFLTKNHFLLILLILTVFFACGMEEEDTSKLPIQPEPADPVVEPEPEPEPILYGTVSGRVTDAITKNPIPGAVVRLFGLEVNTEMDGSYTFQEIPYKEEQTLTVHDPDYQENSHDFTLNQLRLTLNVPLTPLKDHEEELNAFLENFSNLIESLDSENIDAIQSQFSEAYLAADDPVTTFGVISGVVPPNYEGVIPSFTTLFETYSWLDFVFKDREMDITHARKASIQLLLDVDSEKAEDKNLRHLEARCVFEFRREDSVWKIVHWQLLHLDIQL